MIKFDQKTALSFLIMLSPAFLLILLGTSTPEIPSEVWFTVANIDFTNKTCATIVGSTIMAICMFIIVFYSIKFFKSKIK